MRDRLREFSHRDLSLWDEDDRQHPGFRCICSSGCAGVTSGGADHCLRARLCCLGDRHRHTAILEGSGRIGAFELEPDVVMKTR